MSDYHEQRERRRSYRPPERFDVEDDDNFYQTRDNKTSTRKYQSGHLPYETRQTRNFNKAPEPASVNSTQQELLIEMIIGGATVLSLVALFMQVGNILGNIMLFIAVLLICGTGIEIHKSFQDHALFMEQETRPPIQVRRASSALPLLPIKRPFRVSTTGIVCGSVGCLLFVFIAFVFHAFFLGVAQLLLCFVCGIFLGKKLL